MRPPEVILVSGQKLEIRGVQLFDEAGVAEVAKLKAAAARQMGGVTTGIGFIGSPAWALGGAAVLGLLEGALSSAAQKQGVELLTQAQQRYREVQKNAQLFSAWEVSGIDDPYPQAWRAERRSIRSVDISVYSGRQRKGVLAKYSKTESDVVIRGGKHLISFDESRTYVFDGGDFITIDSNVGLIKVKWEKVMAFFGPEYD